MDSIGTSVGAAVGQATAAVGGSVPLILLGGVAILGIAWFALRH